MEATTFYSLFFSIAFLPFSLSGSDKEDDSIQLDFSMANDRGILSRARHISGLGLGPKWLKGW